MNKIKNSIAKTRKSLIEAYLNLLAKNEGEKADITITAVSEEANVNRGTFYARYSSIEALDADAAKVVTEELFSTVFNVPMREIFSAPLKYIEVISKQIEDNFELIKKLERTKYADDFMHERISIFVDKAKTDRSIKDIRAKVGSDSLFAFIVFAVLNGIVGVARECISGNLNIPIGSFKNYIVNSIESLLTYIKYVMDFKEVLPTGSSPFGLDDFDKFNI